MNPMRKEIREKLREYLGVTNTNELIQFIDKRVFYQRTVDV